MSRVQEEIYSLLNDTKESFTISQIAKIIDIDRHTASKFLDTLVAQGLCDFKTQGKAKLYKATHSPLFSMLSKDTPISVELKDLLKKVGDTVTIQDDNHSILWSNKPQQVGKKCYEIFAGKNHVCDNCEVTQDKHFHVKCQDHELIGTTLTNHQNKLVGRMNIRR